MNSETQGEEQGRKAVSRLSRKNHLWGALAVGCTGSGWWMIVHGIARWWGGEWYWIGSGICALVFGLVLLSILASEVRD
jgi:hypothetical protein